MLNYRSFWTAMWGNWLVSQTLDVCGLVTMLLLPICLELQVWWRKKWHTPSRWCCLENPIDREPVKLQSKGSQRVRQTNFIAPNYEGINITARKCGCQDQGTFDLIHFQGRTNKGLSQPSFLCFEVVDEMIMKEWVITFCWKSYKPTLMEMSS